MTATRTQKTAIDQRFILELSIDASGEVTRKPSQLGRKDTLEGKLLAEIYPGIQVARVSVPHELTPYEQSVVENRMAKLIYGGVEYRLVGASNSAKDGKFYFVDLAPLCANMSETSTPWTITVGRRRKSHLGKPLEPSSAWFFFRCVGRFGA